MADAVQLRTKTKKKKPKITGGAIPSITAGGDVGRFSDIKSLIQDHSLFFDKLIQLIPAKFYLPNDAQDKPWFQGLSKAAKVEAKQKSIDNTKKSRRERLDPEKASKTTLDLLKESLENEKSKTKSVGFDAEGLAEEVDEKQTGFGNLEGDDRSVTYEELRQRLHRKIEELRAGRGGGVNVVKRDDRRERKDGKKRRRDEEQPRKGKDGKNECEEREEERDFAKEASEAAEGIQFGKLKLGGNEERDGKKKKKKRKLSKEEELERALRMEEEAKNDPEIAKKQAWKVAMERAKGKKVHDDPKKLKETIKREKKQHKKSAEKWKERVESLETKKQERQDKRKGNIKAKIDQKKMRKIEKREKKLMRPGFEGRKEGFIN
ncbi:hypothetical protein Dimus_011500 [Dionaea muscipula]